MIIVHGKEEILSYDCSHTTVSKACEAGHKIVVMDNTLQNSNDDAKIEIGLYNGGQINKMNTQFVRNDKLDVIKINGDIVFPTIRGFKHINKIGKNDLVRTYDGDLILCKKQEPVEDNDQWYYIKSNIPSIICIDGIFMEI